MSVGPISGELVIESNFHFYNAKNCTEKWSWLIPAIATNDDCPCLTKIADIITSKVCIHVKFYIAWYEW